ncbi:MAG: TIGR04255 family protein [Candidatus Scalindua sp.]
MTLPSYKNPPINEVFCGMQFHTPANFRITHIGTLWNKFRDDYPIVQHVSPIASVKGEIILDNATMAPLPRVWFIKESDDQLIQFQADRFYFNWRRRENDYPRFNYVIESFENVRDNIKDFFAEFELGELNPIEYELSYINHIPQGQGWDTIDDLPSIFSDFVWKKTSDRFLSNPEKVAWQTEFSLPENKGCLTVSLKQGIRVEDKVPLLILILKTRGVCESPEKEAVREWFNLSHEWIVKGFTDLTTPAIQEIWEKEENG